MPVWGFLIGLTVWMCSLSGRRAARAERKRRKVTQAWWDALSIADKRALLAAHERREHRAAKRAK